MKRLAIFSISFLFLVSSVFAVPFASQIRVSDTNPSPGVGMTIDYFINEAGGTVTIELFDSPTPGAAVASFAGTAAVGANSVVWDGTADNAGGTVVPVGEYRVRITVDASSAAGFTEIASNSSVGNYVDSGNATLLQTLWDGFSPMEMLISQNPDADSFGFVLASTSYSTPRIDGHVVFNPDLTLFTGGDGSSTWLNFPGTAANNQSVWGNCFDPEGTDDFVWVCGQSGSENVMNGAWNAGTLTDQTNAIADLANARDIDVVVEGANKYAYVSNGTQQVWKCDVTANTVAASPAPFNVLGLTATGRYSKAVDIDDAGNLYWTSRYNNSTSGDGGVVYRWDAATVQSATAGSLTEANASWEVFVPTQASNTEGIAIAPNGDVYLAVLNEDGLSNDGSLRGIYLIGNTADATNKKTLTVSDRVFAYYSANLFSTFGHGIAADFGGNIYFTDRSNEQIRCVSPGGTTSLAVDAPLSQTVTVALPPLASQFWTLYE